MNIAFFVSNHGYGHLMRELPVIAELMNRGNRVVLITAEGHLKLARKYLEDHAPLGEWVAIPDDVDIGILVIPGTLLADWDAMEISIRKFMEMWPEKIQLSIEILKKYQVDRVLVDIVPWAIPASKAAGIPVSLCSNFTWVDQYEGNLPKDIVDAFRRCYESPDQVLLQDLANANMKNRYPRGMEVGFICRPFHAHMVEKIRQNYSLPIVYVSVGGSNSGIDFEIDVRGMPYQFITTPGLKLIGDHVQFLPVETENTQDYIAAADYCITKAGWGTLAEEMIAGKKTALLERPDVPEDCYNIQELVYRKDAISVSVDALKDMRGIIEKLDHLNTCKRYENNYRLVADLLTHK